jgi:CheY-like chemotaxis protein
MLLSGLGYTVLPAANPGEALRIAKLHEGVIDMLLTDVIMPGMTGYKLAAELDLPELKVLYMSGYTDRALAPIEVPDVQASFLQKPFALSTLARTIRALLAGNSQTAPPRNRSARRPSLRSNLRRRLRRLSCAKLPNQQPRRSVASSSNESASRGFGPGWDGVSLRSAASPDGSSAFPSALPAAFRPALPG